MAFDVKTAAAKLMQIAEAIEKEAFDSTYFVCAKCNHTANLTTIDQRRRKAAAQLDKKMKVSSVSVDDVFSCPACGGDMKYTQTTASAKFYAKEADEGMIVTPPDPDAPPAPPSDVPPMDPKKKPVVVPPPVPGAPGMPPTDAMPPMDAMPPADAVPPPAEDTPPVDVFEPVDEQMQKKEEEEAVGEGAPEEDDMDYDELLDEEDTEDEDEKNDEEGMGEEKGEKSEEDETVDEKKTEEEKGEGDDKPVVVPPEPGPEMPATDPTTGETPIGEVPSSPESPAEPMTPVDEKPKKKKKNEGTPDETPKFETMPPNKEAADSAWWKSVAKYTV